MTAERQTGRSKAGTLQEIAAGLGAAGSRPALLFYKQDRESRWTYGELDRQVARLAAGLAAEDIAPGAPVAVIGGNGPDWVVACLAILRCGATVVPLDAQLGDAAFAHILQDSGARMVFASPALARRHAQRCADAQVEVVGLEASEATARSWTDLTSDDPDPAADLPAVGAEDRAALFYTSGTTGPPKGVPLTHRNIVHQLESLAAAELVGGNERVLVPLPLHHVYPFVVGMLTPLSLHLTLILSGGFTGAQILNALRRGDATLMIGVPRLYDALASGLRERLGSLGGVAGPIMAGLLGASRMLYRSFGWRAGRVLLRPLHRRFAPHLRTLVSGGAALKASLGAELEVFGWRVATGYGLTETSPMVTFDKPGEARLDTVGRPIPQTEVRAEGSAAQPAEILVRGPGVFAGYHNLPDKTGEVLDEDGWFRTEDLGWLDETGRLHIAGRSATLIVTEAGKNVQPEEIEEAYQHHPLIAEIAVFQRNGRLVGLIVPELRAIADGAVEDELRKAVGEASRDLPSYQRIADFAITRDAIPRTRLGKPRRHLIAERYEAARGEAVAVRDSDRRPIAVDEMTDDDRALLDEPAAEAGWALLAERFADRRLTPDSDLQLDLGIDSIDWLDLGFELSERTGVALSEDTIAEIATVRDLLGALAEGEAGDAQLRPLDDPDAALTEAQKAWLRPRGRLAVLLGRVLFALNKAVVRTVFLRGVHGLDTLPRDRPVVFAPNHASYLDPFVLAAALDQDRLRATYWAGWTGVLFSTRLRRAFARITQVLPVDAARAAASSLAFGAIVLRREDNLVWFPEGARSHDGRLQPFKAGLGKLIEHGRPLVVPVAITGTFAAWPVGRRLPRAKPVGIRFLPPREVEALRADGAGESDAARIVDGIRREITRALDQDAPDATARDG